MGLGISILLIFLASILYLIFIYNRFASLKAGMDAAWSDIDIQLKRRYNLVPALVETIKGYKDYETDTLEKIVHARQKAIGANDLQEKAHAATMLSGALGKLFALTESYPDLKANTNFLQLQKKLSDLEDAIQNARRYYNAIVRDYNARLHSFPDLFIARIFSYTPREYFELDESSAQSIKKMPKIEL